MAHPSPLLVNAKVPGIKLTFLATQSYSNKTKPFEEGITRGFNNFSYKRPLKM